MAPPRPSDPDVERLVESIRARLLRAPDRAGAVRYVRFVLDAWNGEPLPLWASPTTPEDTLRSADAIEEVTRSGKRQARYQRRLSSLLAGRA